MTDFFFLEMDSCFKKVSEASFNRGVQDETLPLVKKVGEFIEIEDDFIQKIEELVKNKIGDEFNFEERKRLAEILKQNMKEFLICDQIFKKFGNDFFNLELNTLKFAVF